MATLIPGFSVCKGKMEPGERRFAERLEKKLDDSSLCWFDIPIGAGSHHPDFLVLDPARGLLVVEVKDWKIDTIEVADRLQFRIRTHDGSKMVVSPLEQARANAHAVANILKTDQELRSTQAAHEGGLCFPWGYCVAFTNFTRQQFLDVGLDKVLESARTICKDEMPESVVPETFCTQIWRTLPFRIEAPLAQEQIDRVRWHLFPEVRIPKKQFELFSNEEDGDVMRVMDLQQEQLARSLGEGHRIIHGVAGSGKTLILAYRAAHLAPACTKPILILCYNKALSKKLGQIIQAKKLENRIHVRTFHSWCSHELTAHGIDWPATPAKGANWDPYFQEMVDRTVKAVSAGKIPKAQYTAVLIDEGHDFKPEWLQLVVQMVDPSTNSLLVLFDDAQSIYVEDHRKKFSFKSVGIQAPGRTTILRVNYRNTQEILDLARTMAQDLLRAKESDEDGVPLLNPIGAGRHGPDPTVVKLPSLADEAKFIAERFREANQRGIAWQDMAIIFHDFKKVGHQILDTLSKMGLPVTLYKDATFSATENTIKVLTMESCKGLEFSLVAIPGLGHFGSTKDRTEKETRLLYVAMTRATHELLVCEGCDKSRRT